MVLILIKIKDKNLITGKNLNNCRIGRIEQTTKKKYRFFDIKMPIGY